MKCGVPYARADKLATFLLVSVSLVVVVGCVCVRAHIYHALSVIHPPILNVQVQIHLSLTPHIWHDMCTVIMLLMYAAVGLGLVMVRLVLHFLSFPLTSLCVISITFAAYVVSS